MRLIFSRKGFDSANGGRPSPIVAGRPRSLPIPEAREACTTYADLGLGVLVEQVTGGRLAGHAGCHDDPMFAGGHCWFGQSGSAQGHLRRQGVGVGDLFLFFGLFADEATRERHHRIYGYLEIAGHAPAGEVRTRPGWREPPRAHPHLSPKLRPQNTIYFGPGRMARHAPDSLRLTRVGGPASRWAVPEWLARTGLSRHGRADRWATPGQLATVAIGQEFVCDIEGNSDAFAWLERTIAAITQTRLS